MPTSTSDIPSGESNAVTWSVEGENADGHTIGLTLKIYYDGNKIVVEIYDAYYPGKTRRCQGEGGPLYNEDCGEYICDGLVTKIQIENSWLWASCPGCLRGEMCGTLGRYFGGDCTQSESQDSTNKCYYVFRTGCDTCITPPGTDAKFTELAESWASTYYEAASFYTTCQSDYTGSCGSTTIKSHKKAHKQELNKKSYNLGSIDAYPDDCFENAERIVYLNNTCYENTFKKYTDCCNEIGICDILHQGCIYDMCSCTSGNYTAARENKCLTEIIHESMNTTCSVDELYPTATPTSSPTKTPTGLVSNLPGGTTAEDLVWIMAIFVVVFLLIAGGAYFYYRKKNKGKAYVEDDVQMGSGQVDGGVTYTQS